MNRTPKLTVCCLSKKIQLVLSVGQHVEATVTAFASDCLTGLLVMRTAKIVKWSHSQVVKRELDSRSTREHPLVSHALSVTPISQKTHCPMLLLVWNKKKIKKVRHIAFKVIKGMLTSFVTNLWLHTARVTDKIDHKVGNRRTRSSMSDTALPWYLRYVSVTKSPIFPNPS